MDLTEAFAGSSFHADSGGLVSSFLIVPGFTDPTTNVPFAVAGPLLVTNYDIAQHPSGNGIVLAIFDTTTLPADGRAMFDTPKPALLIPLAAGGFYSKTLSAPWHRYENGLVMVMSTSWTILTYASAQTFFALNYAQSFIGGRAYKLV
jgi:hypothetical protein